MPYNGGPYGIKVPYNQGISTENMAYGPKNVAYKPPHVYAKCTVSIVGGGGLQFVELFLSRVVLVPWFPASSRSPRLHPWTRIYFIASLTFAWICCSQLPYHPCKNGTQSTGLAMQGSTHTERKGCNGVSTTPLRTEGGGDKVQGIVDPRFRVGLPAFPGDRHP